LAHSHASPFVSVVVPVFNGSKTLIPCLRSILSSDLEGVELIVVDDGSSDATSEIASRFTPNVIRHPFNQGRSAARATGHRHARGRIIVCIDSDILIEPSTLRQIIDRFSRDPECAVISGRLADRQPELNIASQYLNLRLSYLYRNLPEKIPFFYGGVFAFRSELKDRFNSDFEICEDTDIGMRLSRESLPVCLDKSIIVQHLKNTSLREFFAADFQMAVNWARLFVRNKVWSYLLLSQPMLLQILRYFLPFGLIVFAFRLRGARFALSVAPIALAQALILPCGVMLGMARLVGSRWEECGTPAAETRPVPVVPQAQRSVRREVA